MLDVHAPRKLATCVGVAIVLAMNTALLLPFSKIFICLHQPVSPLPPLPLPPSREHTLGAPTVHESQSPESTLPSPGMTSAPPPLPPSLAPPFPSTPKVDVFTEVAEAVGITVSITAAAFGLAALLFGDSRRLQEAIEPVCSNQTDSFLLAESVAFGVLVLLQLGLLVWWFCRPNNLHVTKNPNLTNSLERLSTITDKNWPLADKASSLMPLSGPVVHGVCGQPIHEAIVLPEVQGTYQLPTAIVCEGHNDTHVLAEASEPHVEVPTLKIQVGVPPSAFLSSAPGGAVPVETEAR